MALLQECPDCFRRYSIKTKSCKCGYSFSRTAGKTYWIEYYDLGHHRRRERIGPNKAAAEQRLREVLSARTEGRYIRKAKNPHVPFSELAKWYLEQEGVRAKRSYSRDELSIRRLLKFFGDLRISEITKGKIEEYQGRRKKEPSGRTPKTLTMPATINREIACFRSILRRAANEGVIDSVPVNEFTLLPENNVRDRLLSQEEFDRLLPHCPPHAQLVLLTAYHTGMRLSEIMNLTWDKVKLNESLIYLEEEDTKTEEKRFVPICEELKSMLESLPRHQSNRVFTYNGTPLNSLRNSFKTALKKAQIEGFIFHDFRHTRINNWRLEGHDYFRIMAASGHKTMSTFKRYNKVTKEEVKLLVSPARSHQYGHHKEKKG
jgi:integrase